MLCSKTLKPSIVCTQDIRHIGEFGISHRDEIMLNPRYKILDEVEIKGNYSQKAF